MVNAHTASHCRVRRRVHVPCNNRRPPDCKDKPFAPFPAAVKCKVIWVGKRAYVIHSHLLAFCREGTIACTCSQHRLQNTFVAAHVLLLHVWADLHGRPEYTVTRETRHTRIKVNPTGNPIGWLLFKIIFVPISSPVFHLFPSLPLAHPAALHRRTDPLQSSKNTTHNPSLFFVFSNPPPPIATDYT